MGECQTTFKETFIRATLGLTRILELAEMLNVRQIGHMFELSNTEAPRDLEQRFPMDHHTELTSLQTSIMLCTMALEREIKIWRINIDQGLGK